jgi:hypothetical protein
MPPTQSSARIAELLVAPLRSAADLREQSPGSGLILQHLLRKTRRSLMEAGAGLGTHERSAGRLASVFP